MNPIESEFFRLGFLWGVMLTALAVFLFSMFRRKKHG